MKYRMIHEIIKLWIKACQRVEYGVGRGLIPVSVDDFCDSGLQWVGWVDAKMLHRSADSKDWELR
jgi:hypothetical protein